jgi:D-glycero-alpha-D-manno-heptose-7-phosphate kinase
MSDLAEKNAEILADGVPILKFGELLHETWQLKRQLADVTLPVIDKAYEIGRRQGAVGGKLLGAGQGGFLLFVAEPECHDRIRSALPHMTPLQVKINAPGSRVIFAQGNE